MRASDSDIARLEGIYAALVLVVEQRDFAGLPDPPTRVPPRDCRHRGQPALASMAQDATDLWEFYFHPHRRDVSLAVLSERLSDHMAILKAIRRGDGPDAQRQMEAHLDPERVAELIRRSSATSGNQVALTSA